MFRETSEQLIRTQSSSSSSLRDAVTQLSKQYTELPALLSQPHACQRLEIIQYLATQQQQQCAKNQNSTNNKPTLYCSIMDRFLEAATAETLRLLLAIRADMQQFFSYQRQQSTPSSLLDSVKTLDQHYRQILAIWFSPSILLAQRIGYHQTPAAVIERIVRNEAVHPVQGWADLHNRFGPHRRVYALVHPFLLDRPLVVIHVSLQDALVIPNSMRAIHEAPPTEQPTVAAFYSITNLERGLAGIGLGEVLITETVNLLRGEWPCLQEFVTLSPMPHFRKWLKTNHPTLEQAYSDNEQQQQQEEEEEEELLHQLATKYLIHETTTEQDKPLDPVARFHLSNGAEVYRIHTKADLSTRGQQNSFGVMVNYRYDLSRRAERKARYAQNARDFDVAAV